MSHGATLADRIRGSETDPGADDAAVRRDEQTTTTTSSGRNAADH